MFRAAYLLTATMLTVAIAPACVGAQGVDGTWKLSQVTNGAFEQSIAIVKLTTEKGKTTGELVAGNPRSLAFELKSVAQEGNVLRIVFQNGSVETVFEAAIPKDAAKRLSGSVSSDGTAAPAWLSATEETKLDIKTSVKVLVCPPLQEARSLATKAATLRFRAQQTKDAEQKQDLLKQAAEADVAAKKEMPRLYREVLVKHADNPAVFEAAISLMRSAKTSNAKADDVKGWATTADTAAKAYGPRWQSEFALHTATALVGQEGMATLALGYARQAEKSLTPTSAASDQVRVLSLIGNALRKTGQADDAKPYELRVAKLELVLDREYSAKMPGFKGDVFEGRTGKSDRAVFMELFTGAMCPPCVAADLAFDVLQKTYRPSDLVLIQYHMHIPGPDPLTNPDTEERWKYYRAAFPKQVLGVPSSLFNGKPKASGGGGLANAQKKYAAYREVIDPLLEENASVKLTAKAERNGDKIDISVRMTGLAEPGADKKLRILLAEETVRYLGSNKIRLHHNVVRAFPGGVAGQALMEPAAKVNASISLGDLRGQLTKYLDNYEANVRPFVNPSRPLEMEHLRVIAFVQDDTTREILQAVQVEVK